MWISKNMAEDKETAAAAVGIARGSTDARISSVTAGGKGRNALQHMHLLYRALYK